MPSHVENVLSVHCRRCGALPGERCNSDPRGYGYGQTVRQWPHAERTNAWRQQQRVA